MMVTAKRSTDSNTIWTIWRLFYEIISDTLCWKYP